MTSELTGVVVHCNKIKAAGGPSWKPFTVDKLHIGLNVNGRMVNFHSPDLAGVNGKEWEKISQGETITVRGSLKRGELTRVRLVNRVTSISIPQPNTGGNPWGLLSQLDAIMEELSRGKDAKKALSSLEGLEKELSSMEGVIALLKSRLEDHGAFIRREANK